MSLQLDSAVGERLKFGEFELAPGARSLWRRGEQVTLGSRALDILIALASKPGQILSKDDLTKSVWRGAFVDETSLRVGISALRKALGPGGDRYIATVPGRGYCFILDVETTAPKPAPEPSHVKRLNPQRLPAQIARVVGRDNVIAALAAEVTRRRLLSLVGPGGIGKTTVAIAVADRLHTSFDTVAFVELAPIENGTQLATAAAAALGLNLRLQEDPVDEIAVSVEKHRTLIVLDNCEHLVDVAAAFVEALLGRAPAVTILATSRERLRAAGEWVHQIFALDAPPKSFILSAEEMRRYPAVEMFEERAAFALGGYQLGDTDAPYVGEICRRLDGIALAIELAAGRLPGLGVQGLANSLKYSFSILTHGRRTALPRHQTLRATLDWSYQLLSPEDQAALRCLSVFNGSFTLEDAAFVMGSVTHFGEASDRLTSLLDKSLVVARYEERTLRYRLLDTTRAYGQEKLEESGQANPQRRRHAERVRVVFDRATAEWDQRPTADWLQTYGCELGNLRAALDWAFSKEGDGAAGAGLTAAAAPLWFHLSLLDEGLLRVEHATTWLKDQPTPDRRLMMQLYAISGWPRMRAIKGFPSGAAAWRETLALAIELEDFDYQLRAIWALSVDRSNNGKATEALALADRFATLAERAGDSQDRMIGQRIRGKSLHYLGDFVGSCRQIEQMLKRYAPPPQRSHLIRFQYDQRLTAQVTLVRGLWIQGHADQALALVEQMIAEGLALEHTLTLAHILSDAACFIALWAGDLPLAVRYVKMLREHTTLHALDVWRTYADAFEGEILIRRENAVDGIVPLQRAIRSLETAGFVLHNAAFEGVLAEGLMACGRHDEADAIVSGALARCQGSGEAWCVPELMRVRALSLAARARTAEAIGLLIDALEIARSQGALAWELKLASTLAGIDDGGGARDKLRAIVNRISEGFGTRNYSEAVAMLGQCSHIAPRAEQNAGFCCTARV
jgi:predicted ATPase/DNA-binding winged helix-turn-helix (wHTH) protein